MLKTYYEGIEWYDYLVFLAYNGIITYLLFNIGDVFFTISRKSLRVFLLIFQFYFFVIVADSFFNFLPVIHDSKYYSAMIASGQYPQGSPENILPLYYISLFIGLLSLNNPVIYTFISIAFYILSLFILLKAWKKFFPGEYTSTEKIFPYLCLFFPAALLYHTAPLREAYILFGFAVFFSGFLHCVYHKKWLSVLIGSMILCAARIQLIFFIAPVLLFLFTRQLKVNMVLKFIFIFSGITVAYIVTRYLVLKEPFTPGLLSEFRNINLQQGGEYSYGYATWDSYPEMLKDYIFYILQFMVSPLPVYIQHNPFHTILPLFDVILFFCSILVLIFNLKILYPAYKAILVLLLFYILLFGTYEYTLLDAVRHRMPVQLILLLLISKPLSDLITRKLSHAKSKHSYINNQ